MDEDFFFETECKKSVIYTDGSCSPNPGPGGWGLYCEYYVDDKLMLTFEGCEGSEKTTNNIMEITGFYEALKFIGEGETIIYTDSSYVVNEVVGNGGGVIKNGVITGWLKGQRARGWKGGKSKQIENCELWKEIYEYITTNKLTFELRWVRGHNGTEGNEKADFLANEGRKSILK